MVFAEKVKKVRQQLLLTQRDLAQELKVTHATVVRWETGEMQPHIKSLKLLKALCEKNGIDFTV